MRKRKINNTPPICYGIQANIIDRSEKSGGNGLGIKYQQAPTLTKSDRHAVMYFITEKDEKETR